MEDLYDVSMSENDSEVEYLGTLSRNTAMNSFSSTATQQFPLNLQLFLVHCHQRTQLKTQNFLTLISLPSEKISPKLRLYTLSQNVDPAEIVSSSKGITTRKSRGVLKKSRAQLEWESQQKAEALTKKAKDEKHQDNIEKQLKRKMEPRKKDVSQLIDDFSELGSSQSIINCFLVMTGWRLSFFKIFISLMILAGKTRIQLSEMNTVVRDARMEDSSPHHL